jgi:hypothetical protein
MAKQKESSLHWFKFKVLRWNTGDIQDVSYHLKGVFSDLMAYYWSRQCDVKKAQACKKFKDGNINNLCEAGVVKIEGERLVIEFLDNQWIEVQATALENKEKANKRWSKEPCSGNATALPLQSHSNANKKREDKEEIRTEENESERRDPSQAFFRISDQIFLMKPSEYFVSNFPGFYEQWLMKLDREKKIAPGVLDRMDTDYFGYTFNDITHIQNAFKATWKKVTNEKTNKKGYGTGKINKEFNPQPGGFGRL